MRKKIIKEGVRRGVSPNVKVSARHMMIYRDKWWTISQKMKQ